MLIKEHQLNLADSSKIYELNPSIIEPSMCYNNVFRVTTEYMRMFSSNRWRVAYGYISVIENLITRHCFIIDENGDAIDPSIMCLKSFEKDKPRFYMSFKIFDIDEYGKLLEENNWFPDLFKPLRETEKLANKEISNNTNYIII